ncbi:hypothetical protein Barb6XT_02640 [Bacteroidales bacterium Barb6XT]|nr:hypothetical protein Barb6XT_02640 [Bacteroidales bacterium Barb6XT]
MLRATQLISMAVRYVYCRWYEVRTARSTVYVLPEVPYILACIISITTHAA